MTLEEFLKILEEAGAIPHNSNPRTAIMALARIFRVASDMSFDAGYSQCYVDFGHVADCLAEQFVNLGTH